MKKLAVPSSAARQYVTANKRVAAIGGANAHSRPDRLSFVTSFTVSNDTNCFWMPPSYAKRAPGTDSLYYSPFLLRTPARPSPSPLPLPPSFVCSLAPSSPPVSIAVTIARSISSPFRRARSFWHSRTWRVATVKFDLLGLRATSRRKCPARDSARALIESPGRLEKRI